MNICVKSLRTNDNLILFDSIFVKIDEYKNDVW